MKNIHPAYGGEWKLNPKAEPDVFPNHKGAQKDGWWLGIGTQPNRMRRGDVVTHVSDDHGGQYFYDPELKIKGQHFLAVNRNSVLWTEIKELRAS